MMSTVLLETRRGL